MKKKHNQRPTMFGILSDSQASPPQKTFRRLPPGVHQDLFIDRAGVAYEKFKEDVTPDTAVHYVADGAQVVFDECGCGGASCLRFATVSETRHLAEKTPGLLSHKDQTGSLSLWQSEEGDWVVLARGPVRWA